MGSKRVNIKDTQIAHWKSTLIRLPDPAFFDLLRNYLGELKTPYHKPPLLESLEAFLGKPGIKERILSLIDEEDSVILSAIYYTPKPTQERLSRILGEKGKSLYLIHKLRNLQDRLLVYADRIEGLEVFYLNPLLLEELISRTIHLSSLIPTEAFSPTPAPPPLVQDPLFAGFLSFLLEVDVQLKADGAIRKPILAKIQAVFSDFKQDPNRLYLFIRALTLLGLVRNRNNTLIPDLFVWEEFSSFTSLERIVLILRAARGIALEGICRESRWFSHFLQHVAVRDRGYTKTAILRLALLTIFQISENDQIDTRWVDSQWIEDLCVYRVLLPIEGTAYWRINPALDASDSLRPPPSCILQPNFEFTLLPHCSLKEALLAAVCCRIRKYDVYPIFEFTKASIFQGLTEGLTADTIVSTLEGFSQQRFPQNVRTQIESWEQEYRGISLSEGIVVEVDETRRHTIEQHPQIQALIHRTPAKGIYLVRREQLPAFKRLLLDMGMAVPPPMKEDGLFRSPVPILKDRAASGERSLTFFVPWNYPMPRGSLSIPLREPAPTSVRGAAAFSVSPKEILETLNKKLDSLDIPIDQRQEWEDRIHAKVLIDPDQIRAEGKRRERLEAKGVDYAGKSVLIEQTLSTPSDYLELLVRGPQGAPERYLLQPKELKKVGNELVVSGRLLPGETSIEIPIRKISLVRRIKGFLIG